MLKFSLGRPLVSLGRNKLNMLTYFTCQGMFRSSRGKCMQMLDLFLTVRSLSVPKLNCTRESIWTSCLHVPAGFVNKHIQSGNLCAVSECSSYAWIELASGKWGRCSSGGPWLDDRLERNCISSFSSSCWFLTSQPDDSQSPPFLCLYIQTIKLIRMNPSALIIAVFRRPHMFQHIDNLIRQSFYIIPRVLC